MEQEFFTAKEVAEKLKMSVKSIYRRFATLPGVIDLGSKETRYKRGRRNLRIPRSVFDKYVIATSN